MTSNSLLQEFFLRLGCSNFDIPWDQLKERDIDPILEALHALPHRQFDQIEAALHNVFDLACDTGITALLEAADCCGVEHLATELPADGGAYQKAMWVWLHYRQAFEKAVLINQVD